MIEPLLQAERLLLHGMVDQAEALYRSTVEADPRNAIAHVGLARVQLERGQEAVAYGHVCRALEIDSQNAIARRLEARLAEILGARGEPVERPPAIVASDSRDLRPVVDRPAPKVTPTVERAEPTAEASVLARNRSMADHQRMQQQRAQAPPLDPPSTAPRARRSNPRRLLGR
jgi:thioredoxin-like negative regulator of GroEL